MEVDIPEFISHIKAKDYAAAIETIKGKKITCQLFVVVSARKKTSAKILHIRHKRRASRYWSFREICR